MKQFSPGNEKHLRDDLRIVSNKKFIPFTQNYLINSNQNSFTLTQINQTNQTSITQNNTISNHLTPNLIQPYVLTLN